MVNTTDICRIAFSIGILMTLSSSVPQTTREKVPFETVYADRVGKVYGDRFENVYTDRIGQPIYCDDRGDCIRRCGVAICLVAIPNREPRTAQPAQGRSYHERQSIRRSER
jgi:hypothetical protein